MSCGVPGLQITIPPAGGAMAFSVRIIRVCVLLPLIGLTSCQYFGALAAVTPQYESAHYHGLNTQSVGVMVWADRGISIDWPTIQLDLAGSIENKLKDSQKNLKPDELKGTTFPVEVGSIVRYQRDHPDIEAQEITDVAPKLGVSRLIYVEISDFRTRSTQAVELFRGSMDATVKIIEIDSQVSGEDRISGSTARHFPKKSQPEGSLDGQDYPIYLGTIDSFSDAMVDALTRHLIN